MNILPIITSETQFNERLERRQQALDETRTSVSDILARVKKEGDRALRQLTERFDGVRIDDLMVPDQQLEVGRGSLSGQMETTILAAAANIRTFHERQIPTGFAITRKDGMEAAWRWRPIQRVGVYIPGGRYPLLSTILMTVIPAQVAGVAEIVVCTPPGPSGYPADAILGICALLGIREVYRIGGAQAIAALAYGTETIQAVDKITGPGSIYVTSAKEAVSSQVGIDMLAGPSEVVVLADSTANPRWIASDLISQAEHDPLAWSVLVTDNHNLAQEVNRHLAELLKDLTTRSIAEASLKEHGFIFLGENLATCTAVTNRIAPEHLCLQTARPEDMLERVRAGAIFIGGETPVAWGDYWAGPSHTLPTAGHARFQGPLSVYDFLVPYSVIKADARTARVSGDKVKALAELEGLAGHALSITLREENDD
ncbi:MAG: histidinol dehydrogenase [Fidelibacterota bacterium]|nr:MAG: histidinol dehydrogenase [Candidatus Neomarinimicrobiota bacterium]